MALCPSVGLLSTFLRLLFLVFFCWAVLRSVLCDENFCEVFCIVETMVLVPSARLFLSRVAAHRQIHVREGGGGALECRVRGKEGGLQKRPPSLLYDSRHTKVMRASKRATKRPT